MQTKLILISSAAFAFVLVAIVLVVTSQDRRYGHAVKAYRAGQYEEALGIVSSLSQQYQQRSTATYLKSDVLLNLAQQHIENAEYYTALSCLREIPATFQKYDCVPDLIEIASSERDRLIAEKEVLRKKQSQADAQRRTAQSYARPSGGYMGFSEAELQRLYNRFQREGYSSEDAILTVKGMLDYADTRSTARQWLRNN